MYSQRLSSLILVDIVSSVDFSVTDFRNPHLKALKGRIKDPPRFCGCASQLLTFLRVVATVLDDLPGCCVQSEHSQRHSQHIGWSGTTSVSGVLSLPTVPTSLDACIMFSDRDYCLARRRNP